MAAPLDRLNVQVFTAGGTYTPSARMQSVLGLLLGGGGGGGSGIATDEVGGGGGAGGTAITLLTAAQIGASRTVAIGAAGAADTAGGDTTLGSPALLEALGGSPGGQSGSSTTLGVQVAGGVGGTGGGDLTIRGQAGNRGVIFSTTDGQGGPGGNALVGGGGAMPGGSNVVGNAGGSFGGGGSGGHASGTSNKAGGAGAAGILFLIEFVAAEPIRFNNYLFVGVGGGMGTGEKIR